MRDELMVEILLDIITKDNTYVIKALIEDEDFIKYKEIAFSNYCTYDDVKNLIIKYGYEPVNDACIRIAGLKDEQFITNTLITDLRAGYDADPEQALKELDRLNDLCAEAADALEALK